MCIPVGVIGFADFHFGALVSHAGPVLGHRLAAHSAMDLQLGVFGDFTHCQRNNKTTAFTVV